MTLLQEKRENTMLELVQRLDEGKPFDDILGITCRKGEEIIRTADRPYIEDLDSLPFPAHHLWPLDRLKKYGSVMFPLMTSRGCVYWCEFCSAVRMFGRAYRMRSPKNVVDEMEFLHKTYGTDTASARSPFCRLSSTRHPGHGSYAARHFLCRTTGGRTAEQGAQEAGSHAVKALYIDNK